MRRPAHHRAACPTGRLRLPARRAARRAHPRRRRGAAGQDQRAAHARGLAVRQPRLRAHQQSLGPRPHARAAAPAAARPRSPPGSRRSSSAATSAARSACPAAFCGVYGHKPSETALPRSGQFPFPPMPNAAALMGVQGPLARSAEDLDLALAVAGRARRGRGRRLDARAPARRAARAWRTSASRCCRRSPGCRSTTRSAAALDDLAAPPRRPGARVAEAQPDGFGDLREHHGFYRTLLSAVTGARLAAGGAGSASSCAARAGDEFRRRARARLEGTAATSSAGTPSASSTARPTAPSSASGTCCSRRINVLAFPHLERAWPLNDSDDARPSTVDGQTVPYCTASCYPGLATLSGQPATAFPVGLTRGGLPIGLQAIGPYLEDRTPIRFAALSPARSAASASPPATTSPRPRC